MIGWLLLLVFCSGLVFGSAGYRLAKGDHTWAAIDLTLAIAGVVIVALRIPEFCIGF